MESTIQYVRLARSGIGSGRKSCHVDSRTSWEPLAKLMSRPLVHTESGQPVACSKLWLTMVWWL